MFSLLLIFSFYDKHFSLDSKKRDGNAHWCCTGAAVAMDHQDMGAETEDTPP